MNRRRAVVAAAVALPLAATGITAATVAPAAAAAGNTTVTCTVIPATPIAEAILDCLIVDPDGIRTIGYVYPEFPPRPDRIVLGPPFECGGEEDNTQYGLGTTPPTRIKMTVVDCDNPRNRTSFVVRPDGTVKLIRTF